MRLQEKRRLGSSKVEYQYLLSNPKNPNVAHADGSASRAIDRIPGAWRVQTHSFSQ